MAYTSLGTGKLSEKSGSKASGTIKYSGDIVIIPDYHSDGTSYFMHQVDKVRAESYWVKNVNVGNSSNTRETDSAPRIPSFTAFDSGTITGLYGAEFIFE